MKDPVPWRNRPAPAPIPGLVRGSSVLARPPDCAIARDVQSPAESQGPALLDKHRASQASAATAISLILRCCRPIPHVQRVGFRCPRRRPLRRQIRHPFRSRLNVPLAAAAAAKPPGCRWIEPFEVAASSAAARAAALRSACVSEHAAAAAAAARRHVSRPGSPMPPMA